MARKKNTTLNDAMLKEYITLAKRADQRMVRLERLSKTDSIYEGAKAHTGTGAARKT